MMVLVLAHGILSNRLNPPKSLCTLTTALEREPPLSLALSTKASCARSRSRVHDWCGVVHRQRALWYHASGSANVTNCAYGNLGTDCEPSNFS